MKKFDECILHIGTSKTGTTTLQKFFRVNESNLAKKDIFFPKTFGAQNQVKLFAYACEPQRRHSQKLRLGLTNVQQVEVFRNKIWKSFCQEIKNNDCNKLLLSTEFLNSNLTSYEEVKFLKNFLDNFVNTYKVIVYIQPQHEMAISIYSNTIQAGGTRRSILPEIDENNFDLNYEKILERWGKIFGMKNIFPRIFSKKELFNGDIKRDFVDYIGLDWNDFEDVENENMSLNVETQLFLLEINPFLPRFIGDKLNMKRRHIVDLLSRNGLGKGLMPTREEAVNFFKIFSSSNEQVRKKWFPNRKELFEVDFSKYPEKPNHQAELRKMFLQKLDSKERKKYEMGIKDYIKTNQPSIGKRTKTKITNFILRKVSPTTATKISIIYSIIYRKIVNKSPSKYHQ